MPDLDDNYKAERSEEAKQGDHENEETEQRGGGDRPAGTRTMEDATGINVEESEAIDEDMPPMPPA